MCSLYPAGNTCINFVMYNIHMPSTLYMVFSNIHMPSTLYMVFNNIHMSSTLYMVFNNMHMPSTLYMVFNIINIVLTNWCKGDYIYINWILVNQRPHNIKLPINVFRIDSQYSKQKSRKHSQWKIYLSISLFLYYIKWTATQIFFIITIIGKYGQFSN